MAVGVSGAGNPVQTATSAYTAVEDGLGPFRAVSETGSVGWLSHAEMKELVQSIVPRPGWELRFTGQLVIMAKVPNTRYEADPTQKRTVEIGVTRNPPDAARQGGHPRFLRWVLYEYLWLTMHEELEWFRNRWTLLPIVDPHDAEATATRLLPPRPGESWWM